MVQGARALSLGSVSEKRAGMQKDKPTVLSPGAMRAMRSILDESFLQASSCCPIGDLTRNMDTARHKVRAWASSGLRGTCAANGHYPTASLLAILLKECADPFHCAHLMPCVHKAARLRVSRAGQRCRRHPTWARSKDCVTV